MPKQTIQFTTATGTVKVVRTETKATLTIERVSLGFKEKTVSEITKLDDTCIHHAFASEASIKEIYKNL